MGHGIMQHDSMFSVRQMPWHGLGAVLDQYPDTVDEALELAGLTWNVKQGDVFVAQPPIVTPVADVAAVQPGVYVPALESNLVRARDFRANVRADTGEVLGIVSGDYRVVENREAFAWLDALLGGEIEVETAGSLGNGRRVWVLAKVPGTVEIGGDDSALYVYCANSHDGSMAVTAAATRVRIVCANTLGAALSRSERCPRTYKFRHTGDLDAKLREARRVMEITTRWDREFKAIADSLARQPMPEWRVERLVRGMIGADDPKLGDRAKANRQRTIDSILGLYRGEGSDGDTRGNSPGTAWAAYNAIAEHADWHRRYTKRTDQMARSFEDQAMKDDALARIREEVGV